jgi:Methyltransferase domain
MTYPLRAYPALRQSDVENAKLLADRYELIKWLAKHSRYAVIAEIGVARGDFSEFLMDAFRPNSFVAFDTFKAHELPLVFGQDPRVYFEDKSHADFFRDRFAGRPVTLEIGRSQTTLASYPDAHFDLIYVDGDHSFEGVREDAELGAKKLKRDGVLVFNDYIMYDHLLDFPHGIVQVVNEMIVEHGWEVIGFALQRELFCDIALTRRAPTAPIE